MNKQVASKRTEERGDFLQRNHKLGFQVSNEQHVNWHIPPSGLAIQTICNVVMKIPGMLAKLTLWSKVLASNISKMK